MKPFITLTKLELEVLKYISAGESLSGIAKITGRNRQRIKLNANDLCNWGFIEGYRHYIITDDGLEKLKGIEK